MLRLDIEKLRVVHNLIAQVTYKQTEKLPHSSAVLSFIHDKFGFNTNLPRILQYQADKWLVMASSGMTPYVYQVRRIRGGRLPQSNKQIMLSDGKDTIVVTDLSGRHEILTQAYVERDKVTGELTALSFYAGIEDIIHGIESAGLHEKSLIIDSLVGVVSEHVYSLSQVDFGVNPKMQKWLSLTGVDLVDQLQNNLQDIVVRGGDYDKLVNVMVHMQHSTGIDMIQRIIEVLIVDVRDTNKLVELKVCIEESVEDSLRGRQGAYE